MPRKITAAAAPASLPPAAAAQSMPIGPEPADWSDVLGELQGDAGTEVHVYAEPEKGQGGAAWCFSCSPEDYTWSQLLDRIKSDPDLGPGRYSLRAKRGSQFVGSKRIQIAGRPRPAVAVVTPAPVAPPAEHKQSEFLEKLVLALIARPVQESKSGIGDVIEAAKLLTEGRTERNPVKELKEVLELRDLLREPKAEGEGDAAPVGATMADLILEAVRTFGRPIAALASTDTPAPPAAAPAPPQALAAPAPAPKPKPAAGGAAQLKQMIGLMLRGAANGSSPEAYAELALDLMGDDNAALLLQQPDPLALIVGLDARVQPHREWFGQVLQAARELLGGDTEGGLTGAETAADGSGHDPAAPEPGDLAET